ncbi:hypothetical protein NQ318_018693 [Aromia moschata]|uniref:Uncharacterized protein n=1 Tax=Aromia moschata TaxID=1265417 RepID=A0AAV8ZIR6_9CUCU|nr:hypothetical protein NQ318_018693 [Aromia moschata]
MDTKVKVVFLLVTTAVNAGLIAVSPQILEGPSTRTVLLWGTQAAPNVIATAAVGQSIPLVDAPVLLHAAPATVAVNALPELVLAPAVEASADSTETKAETDAVSVEAAAAKSAPEKNKTAVEVTAEVTEVTKATTEEASTEAPKAEEKNTSEETAAVAESASSSSSTSKTTSETAAAKSAELEGQYVPDNSERQFDDGLYKPDAAGW